SASSPSAIAHARNARAATHALASSDSYSLPCRPDNRKIWNGKAKPRDRMARNRMRQCEFWVMVRQETYFNCLTMWAKVPHSRSTELSPALAGLFLGTKSEPHRGGY